MTLRERINALKADEGVSPVIAVILMVAITVVLAATVYVWVSGFANEQEGPEQASATASGVDLDDNGDVEWVKLTLTQGENAPYDEADVTISATGNSGNALNLCESAQGTAGTPNTCSTAWGDGSGDTTWDTGENLWFSCEGDGNHVVSASVGDTTILESSIDCDEDSP
jgi:flagellin-like protein